MADLRMQEGNGKNKDVIVATLSDVPKTFSYLFGMAQAIIIMNSNTPISEMTLSLSQKGNITRSLQCFIDPVNNKITTKSQNQNKNKKYQQG